MFFDFNNRGEMRLNRFNDTALTNNPTTAADAGTGFLMNLGYTIVSNGWDFGAIDYGRYEDNRSGRDGWTLDDHRSFLRIHRLRQRDDNDEPAHLSGGDATTKTGATLTRRAFLNDPPTVVPATGWDYTSTVGPTAGTAIKLTPAGPFTHELYLRIHVRGEESRGGRNRSGGDARFHLLPAARDRSGQSARRRRAEHVQLFHLAALAHLERFRGAGLQPGRRRPARRSTEY